MQFKNDKLFTAVYMITYNHEAFIEDAVLSIVKQKTNFNFKLFLGEDCSTDRTGEICEMLKEKYPEKISLVRNISNLGASKNALQIFNLCFKSGAKYIALCEGDDYWTDPNKLQKQVEFLESHQEYVGCFHNTEERYETDENKPSFLYCDFSSAAKITFSDLCFANLMPTCSVIFRNNLFDGFPEWFFKLKMGDWPLHLLNAQFGDFWYMPKVMAVHRLNSQSVWMLQDQKTNNKYTLEAYEIMIEAFKNNKLFQQQLVTGKKVYLGHPELNSNKLKKINKKLKNLLKQILPYFLVKWYKKNNL